MVKTKDKEEGIWLTCPDKNCQRFWKYKGKKLKEAKEGRKVFVTCPNCHKSVKVKKE